MMLMAGRQLVIVWNLGDLPLGMDHTIDLCFLEVNIVSMKLSHAIIHLDMILHFNSSIMLLFHSLPSAFSFESGRR